MRKFAIVAGLAAAFALGACQGETTEVEQPVVTDAVDTGVDPIDTDQEAAPATGGAAVVAPGTEADVGALGPSDVGGNQADALNVTTEAEATVNGM